MTKRMEHWTQVEEEGPACITALNGRLILTEPEQLANTLGRLPAKFTIKISCRNFLSEWTTCGQGCW